MTDPYPKVQRGIYGSVAGDLRRILDLCRIAHDLTAEPGVTTGDVLAAWDRIQQRVPEPSSAPVRWLSTPIEQLPGLLEQTGLDDAAALGEWHRAALEHLDAHLEQLRHLPWFRSRIRPPLWPVEGNDRIARVLIADDARVAGLEPRVRSAVWALLVRAEGDAWAAIRWAVADRKTERDPFSALLELRVMGVNPIGFTGQEHLLWSNAPPG